MTTLTIDKTNYKEVKLTPNITKTLNDDGEEVLRAKIVNKSGRDETRDFLLFTELPEQLILNSAKNWVSENDCDPWKSKYPFVNQVKNGFHLRKQLGDYKIDEFYLRDDYSGDKPLGQAKEAVEFHAQMIDVCGEFYKQLLHFKERNNRNSSRELPNEHCSEGIYYNPGLDSFQVTAYVKLRFTEDIKEGYEKKVKTFGVPRFNGDLELAKESAKIYRQAMLDFCEKRLMSIMKAVVENNLESIDSDRPSLKEIERQQAIIDARRDFSEMLGFK